MAPAAVVEALDVFEDRVGELDAGVPPLPVEQFGLHACPERFGDNAQLAVSADHVIIAVSLSQSTNDKACFVPMMQAAQHAAASLHAQTGSDHHLLGTVLADAGYASDAHLAAAGPDRLIALARGRDQSKAAASGPAQAPPPSDATIWQLMAHRLRTEEGRTLYKRRGATVEPAIGHLKTPSSAGSPAGA